MKNAPLFARIARQSGLTLVELMVALTLGLFLTLGLILMMSDTSRTFKIQDDFARMQENGASGLRYIGESLRHAGFYGAMAETGTLQQYGNIGAITNDCGNTFTTTVPVFGYHALTPANVGTTIPCIKTVNFQPGPVMIVRLTTGLAVTDPSADGENTLYAQSNVSSGFLLRGGDFANFVGSGKILRLGDGAQFPVFPYQVHAYYIRPCSRPTGGAASDECRDTDDSGRPVPTLVRQELQGTTMVERPLAEGVERISLLYGIDLLPAGEGDGVADRFVADPLSVASDGWARVVSVRVSLLVRSPTIVSGHDDSGKSYDLDGDGTPDFTCAGAIECSYKRSIFSQLIQVRNLAFRRGA